MLAVSAQSVMTSRLAWLQVCVCVWERSLLILGDESEPPGKGVTALISCENRAREAEEEQDRAVLF